MQSREVVKAKGLNPPNLPFTKGGIIPAFSSGGEESPPFVKGDLRGVPRQKVSCAKPPGREGPGVRALAQRVFPRSQL
jgi:hypothetical protein